MKLSIIIPTINEAGNIQALIPRIQTALKTNYTVVIVDDNSTDGTQTVVTELSSSYPIRIIPRPQKLGLASAVIEGIKSDAADAYIIMDADLSHPPEILQELRSQIEIYDLVVASRHVKGGSTSGWPFKRRIFSRVAIMLARPLTPIKDATSGFFAIRRECLEGVHLTPLGFKIGLECFVKAKWKSFSEIPFAFRDRSHGQSKLGYTEIAAYIRQLFHLYMYTFRKFVKLLIFSASRNRSFHEADYDWTSWYRGNPVQKWWKKTLARKVLKYSNLSHPAKIIDIGCGSSPLITLLDSDCIGIDTNVAKLRFMRKRSTASFLAMDAQCLTFKDYSFDHVLCIELIEHLHNLELAISEISRILKPLGTAVIATPDYGTLRWRIIEGIYSIAMPYAYASDHVTKLTRKSLIELCAQHGLTHIATEYVLGADMVLLFQKSAP